MSFDSSLVQSVRTFWDPGAQTFFGYYDLSPFDSAGSRLLAQRAPVFFGTPGPDTPLELGYFRLDEAHPQFHQFASTTAWCWQQGCRLQWFPWRGADFVLFNTRRNGALIAVVADLRDGTQCQVSSLPLYSVSSDGRFGLSLNFHRLQELRPGYGYVKATPQERGTEPGIWRVDLQSGETRQLLSLDETMSLDPQPSMQGAAHYFNHLSFNPSGNRFMVFHLWVNAGRRFSRLITLDINGGRPWLVTRTGFVSHYDWLDDSHLLVFSGGPELAHRYYLYRDLSTERTMVAGDVLQEDGHPSYTRDRRMIVTDTYPDRFREQHLLVYSPDADRCWALGAFYSPPRYRGEIKADLHPRWDLSGTRLCIDSAHLGHREMIVLELNTDALR